ncbi:bifunctional DNA primase/polymerase [Streptomyces sp. ST2-7A]|uniref:bifunctional DNA primase/polymerase n=1 Tax=Streptomyces sp. ST2-7A TaxID=2907214 RepID=UPI001F46D50C|nr:bifunctional DNA primase/polymerase [Streptomyces sp. ST2-7A]MCE7079939.1 bifunctional DNA primase/polymerase [Streptomyces sp. ST2-7A]
MGITIGGTGEVRGELREMRLFPRVPRRRGTDPVGTAVAEYTALRGWDVVPGVRARYRAGRAECSCARAACPAPGAHPLSTDPAAGLTIPAGTPLPEALTRWSRTPGASLLLPAGRFFEVLDAPGAAGRAALDRLERLGLSTGPVVSAPGGRLWFLVAPGITAEHPTDALRTGDGWRLPDADLRAVGRGGYVTAPPSDHAGRGPVRWLRDPGPDTGPDPTGGRMLLRALTHLCRRGGPPRG